MSSGLKMSHFVQVNGGGGNFQIDDCLEYFEDQNLSPVRKSGESECCAKIP
jgi:hypothetical protein